MAYPSNGGAARRFPNNNGGGQPTNSRPTTGGGAGSRSSTSKFSTITGLFKSDKSEAVSVMVNERLIENLQSIQKGDVLYLFANDKPAEEGKRQPAYVLKKITPDAAVTK